MKVRTKQSNFAFKILDFACILLPIHEASREKKRKMFEKLPNQITIGDFDDVTIKFACSVYHNLS